MKKSMIVLSIALFHGGSLYGMEQALSCVNNKMSTLVQYFKPSLDSQQCSAQQMPLVVQGAIVKNIFNLVEQKKCINQDSLEKYVLEIPLDLGCKFIGEFVQMQKICGTLCGGKNLLPHELFCLPRNERDVFIRMANRPFIEGGNIDHADYEILIKISHPELIKGLCLKVLPDNKVVKLCEKIKHIGVLGIPTGFASLACAIICSTPNSLLCQFLLVMSGAGILGGYGVALSSEKALDLYNTYYCGEKVETITL